VQRRLCPVVAVDVGVERVQPDLVLGQVGRVVVGAAQFGDESLDSSDLKRKKGSCTFVLDNLFHLSILAYRLVQLLPGHGDLSRVVSAYPQLGLVRQLHTSPPRCCPRHRRRRRRLIRLSNDFSRSQPKSDHQFHDLEVPDAGGEVENRLSLGVPLVEVKRQLVLVFAGLVRLDLRKTGLPDVQMLKVSIIYNFSSSSSWQEKDLAKMVNKMICKNVQKKPFLSTLPLGALVRRGI
jgi:hypothetical protein